MKATELCDAVEKEIQSFIAAKKKPSLCKMTKKIEELIDAYEAPREKILEHVSTKEFYEYRPWSIALLNNFFFHMPGGPYRPGERYGYSVKENGHKTYAELDQDRSDGVSPCQQSPLKARQTPAEFYKTIDNVLDELGIKNKVERLVKKLLLSDFDSEKLGEKVAYLLIPAYVLLRTRGYNQYPDLIA